MQEEEQKQQDMREKTEKSTSPGWKKRKRKKKSTFLSSKPATRRWLLHYAFTCHRLTHVNGPLDRSSVSHIADMWLEAVGCLVGTEAAGGTPPSRLRLTSAAHTLTQYWRVLILPQRWTLGLVGGLAHVCYLYPLKDRLLCSSVADEEDDALSSFP